MVAAAFRSLMLLAVLGGLGFVGWQVWTRLDESDEGKAAQRAERMPTPVEVAEIEQGRITLRRTLSGSLEASQSFVVAAKVGGRIKKLAHDIGDQINQGDAVAWLDDEEFAQQSAQAKAELEVARADLVGARHAVDIAKRTLERMKELQTRGVESESQLDVVMADHLGKQAALAVAEARVKRSAAMVAADEIRLGYAVVNANWPGNDKTRVVGERFLDEGQTVSANEPLLRILQLDPITAVVFVAERDYKSLKLGQNVGLSTDAFAGMRFEGRVVRIAPLFRRATRQARVEIDVPNSKGLLKPGMFVRINLELQQEANATIVPRASVTKRDDQLGVFVLAESDTTARWHSVTLGIREGERLQVFGAPTKGFVVTLGQQLLADGARVAVIETLKSPEGSRSDGAGSK